MKQETAKILLAVTGSIAAYKAAHLTRLLVKAGAEVKVLMTPASTDFITPLTLSTLSKNPVGLEYFDKTDGSWNSHVELGLWADAMLIVPASANSMAAMVSGRCDNLLLATYLSARCPVFFAPAMDLDMFAHPATSRNVRTLVEDGNILIEPGSGELASGLEGKGRMAEPEEILLSIARHPMLAGRLDLSVIPAYDAARAVSASAVPANVPDPALDSPEKHTSLSGRRFLVTAGPTHEPIDPVRFIGNHSTGKMGFALAQALADLGGRVTLVTGPTRQVIDHPRVTVVPVGTAAEMAEASLEAFPACDGAVLSAAVADYRPAKVHDQKMKKRDGELSITLERTVDIAASLAEIKREDQLVVGFALETENERENALGKMKRKRFDMIVMNSLNDPGAGFGHDTNRVTLMFPDGEERALELKSKIEVARDIAEFLARKLGTANG
jgi:phosphopantothenoylcysteine decarboxylase/phosphopantothenate--cysteine ligase